jgi:hypothetical protein
MDGVRSIAVVQEAAGSLLQEMLRWNGFGAPALRDPPAGPRRARNVVARRPGAHVDTRVASS